MQTQADCLVSKTLPRRRRYLKKMFFILAVSILAITCICVAHRLLTVKQSRLPRPPGPWSLPIFGHLLFLGAEPYKTLLKWKKIYGPIISVQFGSQSAVVITDDKLIKEIYSNNSAADRPHIKYFHQLSRGHKGLIFGLAKSSFEQRQFIIKTLKDLGLGRNQMEYKIMDEVKTWIKEFDDEVRSMSPPGQPIVMNNRFKASVISSFWSIFMGKKFHRSDPEFATIAKEAHVAMASAGVLGDIATFLPWLAKLIPGISGLTRQKEAYHAVYDFAEREIQKHNETRIRDQPRDFTDAYLDKVESTTDINSTFHKSQNYQPITTGDFFFGSLDTISSTLEWLLVQFVRNPAVQNKVYEEVRRVTGNNSRLPSLSDRIYMPYTDAVVHELLRANGPGPLGLPHSTLDDITLGQYLIPKGTMVISNLWGVHHDPETWDSPDSFRPERFLETREGELRVKKNVDGWLPFSHGKRFCPGKTQALNSIFLFTASLAQKFDFQCWENSMPTLDMKHGLVCPPNTFHVKVNIR